MLHAHAPRVRRALVDAPGMTRKVMNFKRLALTDFKVEITRQASKKVLNVKWAEAGKCGHAWVSAVGRDITMRARLC